MKKLILFAALMLFALSCMAADITFEWDNPTGQAWDNVRIYEDLPGTPLQVAEVSGSLTEATLEDVAPGTHNYFARSVMNGSESVNSNTVEVEIKPDTPGNVRVKIIVTVDVNVP